MKKLNRFLLAAPKSGSGKTLFTCGLLAAWIKGVDTEVAGG